MAAHISFKMIIFGYFYTGLKNILQFYFEGVRRIHINK